MTEEEAKTKWCPYARMLGMHDFHVAAASINRLKDGGTARGTSCIASACMAWRWNPIAAPVYSSDYGREPRHGHCGLAGKP